MFLKLIEDLEKRLAQPLPGQSAQKNMAPETSDKRRFNLHDQEKVKPGGVLILLYKTGEKIYFPLIERPEYGGAHSGQIALPGGKKEGVDKSLIDTALREAEEEIGVDRRSVNVIGSLTELLITASNYKVKPVVGYTLEKPEFFPDAKEVVSILEADLFSLLQKNSLKKKEIIIKKNTEKGKIEYSLDAPYFDIKGNVVWGATAMILGEFLTIIKEINRNY